ncbi:ACP S-malonyltransferase [Bacteroidota bacterium]
MKAYVFPGQGAQYIGMGKDLYDNFDDARKKFEQANEILGFKITDIMFSGTEEELKQTKVTQPAIFLHSVILAETIGESFKPEMVAGHSLGEFSALVANKTLSFENALKLVAIRAGAMQKACEIEASTMAAIVVPANYNSPGQIVISGSIPGINQAIEKLKELGAKRALPLNVGGAFHSPLMEPARVELAEGINSTIFNNPICPVFQNVNAKPVSDPDEIKKNLIAQLTSPVRWTQTVKNMIEYGASSFTEVGPGKVLQGLIKKVDRQIPTESA